MTSSGAVSAQAHTKRVAKLDRDTTPVGEGAVTDVFLVDPVKSRVPQQGISPVLLARAYSRKRHRTLQRV